jgi:hypothetical protein
MSNLAAIKASIDKANAAKQAAKIIAEKYPELLQDQTISEFVELLKGK